MLVVIWQLKTMEITTLTIISRSDIQSDRQISLWMSWYGTKSFLSCLYFQHYKTELIRHTGRTQSPTEKICLLNNLFIMIQLIILMISKENLPSKFNVGWAGRAIWSHHFQIGEQLVNMKFNLLIQNKLNNNQ